MRLYAFNNLTHRYFRVTPDGILHDNGVKGLHRIGGNNYKVIVEFDEYTDRKWLEEACKRKAKAFYVSDTGGN